MTRPTAAGPLWIVGAGRLGIALGQELLRCGFTSSVEMIGRGGRAAAHASGLPGLRWHVDGAWPAARPTAVLITVQDSAIAEAARSLRAADLPYIPVLHTSGVLGSEALDVLAQAGSPTGSLHPLVSVADPDRDGRKLVGAWYGVEGAPAAVAAARAMVEALGGRLIRIQPEGKPLYHAAAVIASNYAVALLSVAERVMREAGVEPDSAREALAALAAGAVENVAAVGPVDALTGPISRGDPGTIAMHLERLSAGERPLYSVLARETLLLAMARGLAPDAADRITELLDRQPS